MFPQLFGKYVLEREIAAGGMARVYLATLRGAVGFEKRLVVKQIRPELAGDSAFVQRFVAEAKLSVELAHPNIVPVYELGVEADVYYISMEYCTGVTLAELLAETGPLAPRAGAYLGVEVCRALDYAHRRAGIVHRDVTPRNVMIDDEGAVRVIDFGIAAPVQRPAGRGEVFGSPGHMPIEQLRGDALTPATDVFAVATVLLEAWIGRPPFRRATAAESEAALDVAPPLLSSAIPALAPLDAVVARALSPDPAARPQSAEQLARTLRDFLQGEDAQEVARELGDRVRHVRRRLMSSRPWLDLDAPSDATRPLPEPTTPEPSGTVTRTFAANPDLAQWTRRIETPAAPSPGSGRASGRRGSQPVVAPRTSAGAWRLLAAVLLGMVIAGVVSVRILSPQSAERRVPSTRSDESTAPPRRDRRPPRSDLCPTRARTRRSFRARRRWSRARAQRAPPAHRARPPLSSRSPPRPRRACRSQDAAGPRRWSSPCLPASTP